jgi:hypothetical protein
MTARDFLLAGVNGLAHYYVHPPNLYPQGFFDLSQSITRMDWTLTTDPFGTFSYIPGETVHKIGPPTGEAAEGESERFPRRAIPEEFVPPEPAADYLRELESRPILVTRKQEARAKEIAAAADLTAASYEANRERLAARYAEARKEHKLANKRGKETKLRIEYLRAKSLSDLAENRNLKVRTKNLKKSRKETRRADRLRRESILPTAESPAKEGGEAVTRRELFPVEGPAEERPISPAKTPGKSPEKKELNKKKRKLKRNRTKAKRQAAIDEARERAEKAGKKVAKFKSKPVRGKATGGKGDTKGKEKIDK